ncbi:MAG: thioredoxin family protein [Candidatus Woesearchaeota archaeon]
MVQELKKEALKKIKDSQKPTIIKFGAVWCAPCKALTPVFKELSKEIKKASFYEVNIDAELELAKKFKIMSVPTIIILKKSQETARINGFSNKETLKSTILSKI